MSGPVFWHLTSKGFNPLLHNARLGKGWTVSMDVLAQVAPGATTLYAHLNDEQKKERLWEDVRKRIGADVLPPRLCSFFAFVSREDARRAQAAWNLPDRHLVEVYAGPDAKVHLADSSHLNSSEAEWTEAAEAYWLGKMTEAPLVEVLISGPIFFPGWEEPPFGLFGQQHRGSQS